MGVLVGQRPGGEEKIVFDRFHIMSHMLKAVDTVRKAGLSERISFRQGDIRELPFPDKTFDWAWSVDSVGYPAGDLTASLAGICRVVRPGGAIALLACGLVAVVTAAARTPAARTVALAADTRLGLRERLVTAMECLDRTDAMSQLVVDDGMIASKAGLTRKAHACQKLPGPVLDADEEFGDERARPHRDRREAGLIPALDDADVQAVRGDLPAGAF